jgi:hypothetical protein
MKKLTTDINTKWSMNWRSYQRAKGVRKDKIRERLFELLQINAYINQFNHDNK